MDQQNTSRINAGMAGYLTDHEVRRHSYGRVRAKHPFRYYPKTRLRKKLEDAMKFILGIIAVYAAFWILCFIAATL